MLTFPRWKYALILLVTLFGLLYALPNIYPQDSSVQISSARGAPINAQLQQRVKADVTAAGIQPKAVEIDPKSLLVRLSNPDDQSRAADLLRSKLGSDYVVALNLVSNVPDWLSKLGARPMQLGLDLQGGVHFTMQVDQKAALDKRMEALSEEVRTLMADRKIAVTGVERGAGNSVVIKLANAADLDKAVTQLSLSQPDMRIDSGADTVTMTLSAAALDRFATEAVEQNVGTLRNRINALGVAEPIIQRQGKDRIVVQLAGVQDTAQAKRILGATATLEWRATVDGDAVAAEQTGIVPPNARVFYYKQQAPGQPPIPLLLNKRLIATGDQMVGASASTDPQSGTPSVNVKLNDAAGQRMFDFTSQNVGKNMAVVYVERIPEVTMVDGKEVHSTRVSEQVISNATVNGVFGKDFITSGLGSMQEAQDLALLLRSGSLAAPMDFVEERVVGPSLGKQNVENGLKAILFSFGFALVFFLIYYRMFGIITCLSLLLNLLLLIAVMGLFGATLTLPGLAGIALTVGMSVDANVLINERIREELRDGLPPKKAIAEGYDRASGTIADANLTAILAGIALFAFGTGPVKGFAISMIVGILTSMFTAVTVSRGLATLIYGGKRKIKSVAI
ncbi:protein translocase subunit SecD [Luteimonas sp. FXH3W]|uniref:Protein translocase subunit SecD n=1 Tax=Aquilutibacter rugosus TaxID=3115820 RepID=A0ABU7V220_9GAMM